MSQLIIADTDIRQDELGRYCINDLHRASGGEEKHSPNRFTRSEACNSLLVALTPDLAFAPIASTRGGINSGTYVHEDLVCAYAMWISSDFYLRVIRTYKAVSEGRIEDALKLVTRQSTRDGHKAICHNLKATRLEAGKETPVHVYMNECNMLNRIILGVTAKEFLEARGLDGTAITRDLLTHDQLRAFDELQIVDASLLSTGDDYETRKAKLQDLFNRRHARALIAEFERMNLGLLEEAEAA